jgi:hypothetical protein
VNPTLLGGEGVVLRSLREHRVFGDWGSLPLVVGFFGFALFAMAFPVFAFLAMVPEVDTLCDETANGHTDDDCDESSENTLDDFLAHRFHECTSDFPAKVD